MQVPTHVPAPLGGLADHWLTNQRALHRSSPVLQEDISPESWIDLYCAGLERPLARSNSDKSSPIKATLRIYHGEALQWSEWTAVFHSLVHQITKSPAEKRAILTNYLSDECRTIIYGGGGDEE